MILPDLLAPELDLVLCGTAPSHASAAAQAYYAKPGNLFWPTLYRVGLIPDPLMPAQYPALLCWGIGLTDLCKTEQGSDAELSATAFDSAGFVAKLLKFRPAVVAFTSKTAAGHFLGRTRLAYGLQPEPVHGASLFVLPSPSGRARGYWRIEPWQDLAAVIARRRAARGTAPA
ncbi:MAG: mismatch-specific DNA-glycosylase [Azospirillaceae bacterium]|nr:mismatch-specific DNA-glycosylase [Azospirillaceae bacterium]